MSERIVRIAELAQGYSPDLPDQKPILWEDGRGVLFIDRTLQPMPGQVPLVSVGVPVNAVSGAGDYIFLGTEKSVLSYSLVTAQLEDRSPVGDTSVGDWSFQPFGKWMLGAHGGKLWIWKPRDDEETIDGEANPSYWPYSTFREVTEFTSRGKVAKVLLKCKNFLIVVCSDSILWSDDDNPEKWIPEQDNMAGDLFIRDVQDELRGGIAMEDYLLLGTQKDIVKVPYISRPYIFGYKKIFEGAGIWTSRSICAENGSIFGFGPNGIWVSDGNGITFIDKEKVGDTINEKLDINRTAGCFCAAWNIIQHVFFFVPIISADNSEVLCFGFNLENSTWTLLDWNRFCAWKQYWVDTSGTLYLDDLKNAQNLAKSDGKLPLPEKGEGLIGMCYEGWGNVSYGGKIWCQA